VGQIVKFLLVVENLASIFVQGLAEVHGDWNPL